MRGVLNKKSKLAAYAVGIELTKEKLRLLPYIQSLVLDHAKLDPLKISGDERKIFSVWKKMGLIGGGASEPVTVTKEFWCAMTEILWHTYVNKKEEPDAV